MVHRWLVLALQLSLCTCAASEMVNNYNAKGWEAASKFLSEYMNRAIAPCSDMAKFMCGNFGDSNSTDYQFYLDAKIMNVYESFKSVLMNHPDPSDNRSAIRYEHKLRWLYNECIQTRDDPWTINQAYQTLKETLGEFPLFEESASTKVTSVWFLMGRMQQRLGKYLGMQAGFAPGVLMLDTEIPTQAFPLTYFRNQTIRVAAMLKRTVDLKTLDTYLLEAKHLFYDWKENVTAASRSDFFSDGPQLDDNISTTVPTIDWNSYVYGLLPQPIYDKWIKGETGRINAVNPGYMRQLGDIFRRHPIRAARMLMFGKAFDTLMEDYIKDFNTSLDTTWLSQQYAYMHKPISRSLRCLGYLTDATPAASARMYFDHLGEDLLQWRNEIKLIATNIVSAMRILLNSIDYLSLATKERINHKLDSITVTPAIPSWIMDDTKLWINTNSYNGSLSFFTNQIQVARKKFLVDMEKFAFLDEQMTGNNASDEPPPTFEQNSMYIGGNIKIYLGFILPPVFSIRYPLAVKYGYLGAIIGHELMHGFDSAGIREGAEPGSTLLADDEFEVYERQSRCLVQQYSRYCYQKLGQCLAGSAAINDNIADIGGVKVAYAAYQMAKEVTGDEPPVPGLAEYSNDQLFYMAFQRGFCTRNTPDAFWLAERHSPDDARGPVALRNNPHFAAAFKCPVGSPLAPTRPCEMWGDIRSSRRR